MTPPATDVVRALGDLEGTVRSMSDQWKRQEEAATSGRRTVHDRLEVLSSQIIRALAMLDGVQQDVAELKNDIEEKVMPTVQAYKMDVAKKAGAMGTGKLIWGIILAVCTVGGFAIHEAIVYFSHGTVSGLPRLPGLH